MDSPFFYRFFNIRASLRFTKWFGRSIITQKVSWIRFWPSHAWGKAFDPCCCLVIKIEPQCLLCQLGGEYFSQFVVFCVNYRGNIFYNLLLFCVNLPFRPSDSLLSLTQISVHQGSSAPGGRWNVIVVNFMWKNQPYVKMVNALLLWVFRKEQGVAVGLHLNLFAFAEEQKIKKVWKRQHFLLDDVLIPKWVPSDHDVLSGVIHIPWRKNISP